ncbi:MAG TPA: PKD domain-containing protein, partial [Candidatus Angelobacter sp.]|nr:PKD domain-containing protein [Candidatus Angelobacter sp.]
MRSRRAPLELFLLAVVALLVPFGCSKKDSPTAPKVGPVANFVAAPTAGNIPLDVDFTNQSTSGSSAITAVLWDFGDGTTSTANSTTHLYGSPGTYSISLRVTTADGTDTRTRDDYIVVGNGPGSTPPNAAFTASPTAGSPPLMVSFTDQSSAGSSPITGWSW